MNGREHFGGAIVVPAPFDPDGALRNGRQHLLGVDRRRGDVAHAQPVEPCHGQKRAGRHAVVQFLEPGLNIAAKLHNVEVGALVQQLRLAAEAGSADPRARRKAG